MYTVEIYRADRRTKSGERLVHKKDYDTSDRDNLEHIVRCVLGSGERYEIYETWVTRKNFLSGREYQERYDTARSCSPACELYWTM